jgi:hypothetical protein
MRGGHADWLSVQFDSLGGPSAIGARGDSGTWPASAFTSLR